MLRAALDYARSENSSGVVILYQGRIVVDENWTVEKGSAESSRRYERMLQGTTADGHAIEDVASVQKSIISYLAGIAIGQGKLDMTKPVSAYLGEGWSKAPVEKENAITVRHIMTMTSGLNDALRYLAPAGSKWRYNTGAYSQMLLILQKAFGEDIESISWKYLVDPIGMGDTEWTPRPWAARMDAANKLGFATTTRDLARFGLLIQAGGVWNGTDLLQSPGYLQRALSSSQNMNPAYGLLWWLNSGKGYRLPTGLPKKGSMIVSAPADLVGAMGALGRKVYVVPSLGLVVTRLGNSPDRSFDSEFWKRLMAARN